MKIRSQKGFTGIDIAISVIVITIFVSLIAVLIYRLNSSISELEKKSEAISIAINEIEKVKAKGFETYKDMDKNTTADETGKSLVNQATDEDGYYKTISILDYTDIEGNESKEKNIVKKITVTIKYIFQGEEQSLELSTILAKGE